ncbi:MAG: cation transporter [Chloroflexi bacterium]|nr:cation transporter [Chloroflexota bacterium]
MANNSHRQALPVAGKLKFGIMLTVLILVAEVIGGLLSNSLALLSDAGHILVDIIALSLSWYGVKQAERPSSSRMTFGYHRVGVLIAIVNAVSILAIAAVIFSAAYRRLQQPPEVNSLLMLMVATIGLGVNLVVALRLRQERQASLNVRSAFWHIIGDALASVGVIIGGVIILLSGKFWIDPIISMLIGLVIIVSAWSILKEGLSVLLEAPPPQVNVTEMVNTLKQISGVKDVHDVHVWSISPEVHAMSCHILIDDIPISQAASIRQQIENLLLQKFNIRHTALQMECQDCGCEGTFCKLSFESTEAETEKASEL